jgi:uncharacterized repeat protein (TIGR01451 family)
MRLRLGMVAAAALALSGCGIDKADEHGRQLDVIGNVELSTTFCTSGDSDGNSRTCAPFSAAHRGQVLVAYRLPDGALIPDELTDDGGLRHFTSSPTYAAYMRDTYPEEGMYWAAYVSDAYSTDAGFQNAFTVAPEVTLPDPGAPYAGPLAYQVVGGYRQLAPGDDGTQAVDCTDTDSTACAGTGVGEHDLLQPTRDLAVRPGGDPPVVEAGSHVAVPFDVRFAGSAGDGVVFALSADTGAPSQTTLVPGSDSHNRVTVDVAVPADTEPGDYDVTLTATARGEDDTVMRKVRARRLHVGGVQERSGFMTYRVVAPKPQPQPQPQPQPAVDEPPHAVDPPPPAADRPPPPAPAPVPIPVHAPRAGRARLALSLTASPRRALSGTNVSYRVVARNVSRVTAVRARVCTQLPRALQFVRATAGVRRDGSRFCFTRRRLLAGTAAHARLVVHIDLDAEGGPTRARATASAANAPRVHARAPMRVIEMPRAPRPARR